MPTLHETIEARIAAYGGSSNAGQMVENEWRNHLPKEQVTINHCGKIGCHYCELMNREPILPSKVVLVLQSKVNEPSYMTLYYRARRKLLKDGHAHVTKRQTSRRDDY